MVKSSRVKATPGGDRCVIFEVVAPTALPMTYTDPSGAFHRFTRSKPPPIDGALAESE